MPRVSDVRITRDSQSVLDNLGLLQELIGTWKGRGFNLIARPDFHDKTDLYLQLNQTRETLKFDAIGSAIPNRGFGQDDIELFGLTYLQQISDAHHGGALHIEPGIWITQPTPTDFPPQDAAAGDQLIARMGTIPHGNSLLAEGLAETFVGPPVLTVPGSQYSFSRFPSFNSTPFPIPPFPPAPPPPAAPPPVPAIAFNAAGSSEKLTAASGGLPAFPQYDFTVPIGPIPPGPFNPPFSLNTRTPFGTNPPQPAPPATINGIAMQDIINDPIVLLQKEVQDRLDEGYTFEGTVLNIATLASITFLQNANSGPFGPTAPPVTLPQFGGGIENLKFLQGETVLVGGQNQPQENAQTAVVYATFWIEELTHPDGDHFMQLQYAQMVSLDFPIFHLLHQSPPLFVNLAWPHISVATLKKTWS